MGEEGLRRLRKRCAQSETLYLDCVTAQHTDGHPSSAVCRPLRPGLQTDAARGVPTVCGDHLERQGTYAGPPPLAVQPTTTPAPSGTPQGPSRSQYTRNCSGVSQA